MDKLEFLIIVRTAYLQCTFEKYVLHTGSFVLSLCVLYIVLNTHTYNHRDRIQNVIVIP